MNLIFNKSKVDGVKVHRRISVECIERKRGICKRFQFFEEENGREWRLGQEVSSRVFGAIKLKIKKRNKWEKGIKVWGNIANSVLKVCGDIGCIGAWAIVFLIPDLIPLGPIEAAAYGIVELQQKAKTAKLSRRLGDFEKESVIKNTMRSSKLFYKNVRKTIDFRL